MKVSSITLVTLGLLLFSGCAPKVITLQHKFDSDLTGKLISKEGDNTINGNGFLRQKGGGVVTCSGSEVLLFPKTPYSSDRMRVVFGNSERGYRNYLFGITPTFDFDEDPMDYDRMMKHEICDSQGNFTFNKVGDGEYYLTTEVRWTVGNNDQGGALLQTVRVSKGETKKIVLTY